MINQIRSGETHEPADSERAPGRLPSAQSKAAASSTAQDSTNGSSIPVRTNECKLNRADLIALGEFYNDELWRSLGNGEKGKRGLGHAPGKLASIINRWSYRRGHPWVRVPTYSLFARVMGIKETKIGVLIEYLRWAEMIFIRRDPVTGREELYAPDPRSKNWKFFQKVQLCDFAAVEAVLALPTQLTLFPPEQLIEQLAAAVCEDAVQKLTKMVSSAHRNGQLVHLFGDALHHSGDGAHQNGEFGEIILAASVATEARCRRCSKTLKNGEIVVSEVGDDLFCSSRCETEHALGTPPAINGLIHKFSQERTDELIQGARTQPLPKEAAGYKWLPRDERNFIWKQIRELKVLSLPGSEFHFGRFWRSAVNMIGATPQGCDDLKHALGDLREYINNPGLDPKETAGMKFKWILSDVYGWNATDGPDGYKLWIKGAPGQKSRFAKRSESNQ